MKEKASSAVGVYWPIIPKWGDRQVWLITCSLRGRVYEQTEANGVGSCGGGAFAGSHLSRVSSHDVLSFSASTLRVRSERGRSVGCGAVLHQIGRASGRER